MKINITKMIIPIFSLVMAFQSTSHGYLQDNGGRGSPVPAAYSANIPEYFGFWVSSSYWGNAAQEVSSYANITFVYDTPSIEVNYLQGLAAINMKAVVIVPNGLLFDGGNLNPNWQSNWNTFAAQVAPYINSIEAFYPADEPYTLANGDYAGMLQKLETIGAAIKKTFPQTNLAMLFAAPDFATLENTNIVPSNYNWIGFDCYGSTTNCQGHSTDWYLSEVEKNLYSGQRTFLMADATVWTNCKNCVNPAISQKDMDADLGRLECYFQLAAAHPSVIGVFPYGYYDYNAESLGYWTGAARMPEILAACQKYGASILAAAATKVATALKKAAGFYRIPGGTVYYVDSAGQTCGFENISSYINAGGSPVGAGVQTVAHFSPSWKYQGACVTNPPGFYALASGTIFYFNGLGHYCGFSNWSKFIEAGGSENLNNVTWEDKLPATWINDGACST
jgi:hypothetical protein